MRSPSLSSISHELRTPLHGILAAAELLAETKLNATQGSYLETVEACGKSLLELVNHVLDFTKLSGNTRTGLPQAHSMSKCDLVKLVQEVCESSWIGQMAKVLETQHSAIGSVYSPPKGGGEADAAAPSTGSKMKGMRGTAVETVIDISMRDKGWLVNCDTGGIRRVLMNLIGNSLKFTTAGFVHVSLREIQSSDTHVVVELGVTDTGKGISRAFLEEQLFHPFTQENPLGTGTGLGLSIVNTIVQSPALNGKIDVWSTEGQGTEIRVTCELELCDAEEAEGPIYQPVLNVNKQRSVSLLGFDGSRGHEDLKDVLKSYFGSWWRFDVLEDGRKPLGDIVLINEDHKMLNDLRTGKSPLPPAILLTSARGAAEVSSACDAYHAAGGVARLLFKPGGPAKLEAVVDFCLQCLDRVHEGNPPRPQDVAPSTPLPSPSSSPAPRPEMEKQDSYFVKFGATRRAAFAAVAEPLHRDVSDDVEDDLSDLTPRADRPNPAAWHRDSYHMSPDPPSISGSLIRRHSTEDKAIHRRTDSSPVPSRPMMPARSITYHEPRLNKHVLMSPLGDAGRRSGGFGSGSGSGSGNPLRRREDGNEQDYFGDVGSSAANSPGSTVSLEGGQGSVLKTAIGSTRSAGVGPSSAKKRLQILSVEDNPINRRVIAAFLAKMVRPPIHRCPVGTEHVHECSSSCCSLLCFASCS